MIKTFAILRKQRKRIVALLPEQCGVIESHCKAIIKAHGRYSLTSVNPNSVMNSTVELDSQDLRFSKIIKIIQSLGYWPELRQGYTKEMEQNRIEKHKLKENNNETDS